MIEKGNAMEITSYAELRARSNPGHVLLVRMMGIGIKLYHLHKIITQKFGHRLTYQSVINWSHMRHLPDDEHTGWIREAYFYICDEKRLDPLNPFESRQPKFESLWNDAFTPKVKDYASRWKKDYAYTNKGPEDNMGTYA